jgi:hypothetical protein
MKMKTRTNSAAATESFDLTWDEDYRIRDIVPVRHTKGTETVWMTEQVPAEDLSQAVVTFLKCGQFERPQALAELLDLSRRGTEALSGIKTSLDMILNSGVHERTSAAIQFLSQLGATPVKRLAAIEPFPEANGYALVRALGVLGERDSVLKFVESPNDSVREGVAEALDDIGDYKCLQVLREINESDKSAFVRKIKCALLQDR